VYDPLTDTWQETSTASGVPSDRIAPAIWTGEEMIVWGGGTRLESGFTGGGHYNPDADTWTRTATAGEPVGRTAHSLIWTGSEMIMWGGWYRDTSSVDYYLDDGAKYRCVPD
jgi:hypothetical protein